jgi:cytosine/adenosine deaminase-related metal-dependent hydrolase
MTTVLLRNADRIYTCNETDEVIENGYVLIRDNVIEDIGQEPCPVAQADAVHDLSGCLVIPGFVNIHHHFFQSLTRAIPAGQRAVSLDWLAGMYPLWAEFDPEAIYWGALAAAGELLLSGATTSADLAFLLPGNDGESVGEEVRAAQEIGLRLHLVRSGMPTLEGDIEQQLGPILGDKLSNFIDDEETLLSRMEADVRRHHDSSRLSMLRLDLGPTAVTYEKPSLMSRIADLAKEHGCGLHTHYRPRGNERAQALELTGDTPIKFLDKSGWLGPRTWFAHCTQLNAEEIKMFADRGCGVAHCPRTIIRLGYAVAPIADMRRAGVKVGVGVDGGASNDGGAFLADLRLALLLHRVGSEDDADPLDNWLTPHDVLVMATRTAAAVLGRDDIGRLEPGLAADVAAFDMRRIGYVGALADPLGGLLMSGSDSQAKLTIVNGVVVVEDGKLTRVDESRLVEQANLKAARLLNQAEANTGLSFRDYPQA